MDNKLGRSILVVAAASLLFTLTAGWLFFEKRADYNRNSNSNSSIVSLSQDQLTMVDFVKKNPDLADELNDLIKVLSVANSRYVEEKSRDDLLKMAMRGIPEGLDPNNMLYIGSEADEFKKSFGEQSYFGIGAQIVAMNKFIFITNVFSNSPAEKAGLRPGDGVLKVNDQNVWGMNTARVIDLVKKGGEGSSVTLEINRVGSQQPSSVTLILKKIVVSSLEYSAFDKNIGYIKINSCGEETVDRFFTAADQLKDSRGLMIDLRNNPGGLVSCAQSVLGYFIGIGRPVIVEKYRSTENTVRSTATRGLYPKKVVVLINNNSASASEIIAGNLRHYKVAILVGVRTHGKQTVQTFFDVNTGLSISDLSNVDSDLVLKLTIAHYFLPDGANVSENGVVPDIEVEQPDDFKPFEYKTARDLQFQKAIEILTAK